MSLRNPNVQLRRTVRLLGDLQRLLRHRHVVFQCALVDREQRLPLFDRDAIVDLQLHITDRAGSDIRKNIRLDRALHADLPAEMMSLRLRGLDFDLVDGPGLRFVFFGELGTCGGGNAEDRRGNEEEGGNMIHDRLVRFNLVTN